MWAELLQNDPHFKGIEITDILGRIPSSFRCWFESDSCMWSHVRIDSWCVPTFLSRDFFLGDLEARRRKRPRSKETIKGIRSWNVWKPQQQSRRLIPFLLRMWEKKQEILLKAFGFCLSKREEKDEEEGRKEGGTFSNIIELEWIAPERKKNERKEDGRRPRISMISTPLKWGSFCNTSVPY